MLTISKEMNILNDMREFDILQRQILKTIEKVTIDQIANKQWFEYHKSIITCWKADAVFTKMTKVETGGGGKIDMLSLIQLIKYNKVSELNRILFKVCFCLIELP